MPSMLSELVRSKLDIMWSIFETLSGWSCCRKGTGGFDSCRISIALSRTEGSTRLEVRKQGFYDSSKRTNSFSPAEIAWKRLEATGASVLKALVKLSVI